MGAVLRILQLALVGGLIPILLGVPACERASIHAVDRDPPLSLRHRLVKAREMTSLTQCTKNADCVAAEDLRNDSCCQRCGLPVAAYNRRALVRVLRLYHHWCKPRKLRCNRCSLGCFNGPLRVNTAVCERGRCALRVTKRPWPKAP